MEPVRLRSELERLRGRLRGLYFAFGLVRLALAVTVALAITFALDRMLALPAPVRLVFVGLLAIVTAFAAWRFLWYPLSKRLTAEDVALAVEAKFPALDGRLISTLELEGEALDPKRNVSVELVEKMRAETGALLDSVRFDAIFDRRPLRREAAAAAIVVVCAFGYAAHRPDLTGIFARRLFGSAESWPQRTRLTLVFPETGEHFRVEKDGDRPTRVRMAKGASLPVTVRVTGEDPEFVELVVDDESRSAVALTPTGTHEWVGRFRAVHESFEFRPRGGDDDGGGRDGAVEVVDPPAVTSLAVTVTFPAYTGLEPRQVPSGDVEAVTGSRVDLDIGVAHEATAGKLVFEGGKVEVPLVAPAAPGAGWHASFSVAESTSYAVHLVGSDGFSNLEPATHAVIAVKDRVPVARMLEPARADVDVTPDGLVAFRVLAEDDFGVTRLDLGMRAFDAAADGPGVLTIDLLGGNAAGATPASAPARFAERRLVYTLVDLAKQSFTHSDGVRVSQASDSYVYRVEVADNHADKDGVAAANVSVVADRRVDVVSLNEKMRLLSERQVRRKDDVTQLRQLQQEKRDRLAQILTDSQLGDATTDAPVEELAALEVGQNQVTTRAVRLAREFADLYEEFLLNRIDKSAAAERLIPLLVERKNASTATDGIDFAVYRPIVTSYQSGAFGRLDVLGRVIDMLACILDVGETLSKNAASGLGDARLITDAAKRTERLLQAQKEQDRALARLDELLARMDEWEDFQEIVTLFRDLLDDQRDLNARTRDSLKGAAPGDSGSGDR